MNEMMEADHWEFLIGEKPYFKMGEEETASDLGEIKLRNFRSNNKV
jgi:hypothetical protein